MELYHLIIVEAVMLIFISVILIKTITSALLFQLGQVQLCELNDKFKHTDIDLLCN